MHRPLVSNFPTAAIGRAVNHEAIKAHAFADQGIVVAALNDPRLDGLRAPVPQEHWEQAVSAATVEFT